MLFPETFHAPSHAELGEVSVRLLAPDDAQADFAAVISSASRIRGVFGPTNEWPPAGLTFEENAEDLKRHLVESMANESFAYLIWSGANYAGCLYMKPFKSRMAQDRRRGVYRELCFLWVAEGFVQVEQRIQAACDAWVRREFPVAALVWPGREVSWSQWHAMA